MGGFDSSAHNPWVMWYPVPQELSFHLSITRIKTTEDFIEA